MFNKNKIDILEKNRTEKKVASKKEYFEVIKALESDAISDSRRSKKISYIIATISCLMTLSMTLSIVAILPLKEVQPYVIRVDQNTGFVDVAKPLDNGKTTYEEEIDKYFLAKYITNYESYDWETIQNMADTVKLMSNNDTFSHYYKNLRSEVSPLSLFKDQKKVVSKVISVSFIKDVATVRYVKFVRSKNGDVDNSYPTTKWLATIKYDYGKIIKKENERLINPLGFQVLSYRVDPEAI